MASHGHVHPCHLLILIRPIPQSPVRPSAAHDPVRTECQKRPISSFNLVLIDVTGGAGGAERSP